MAVAAVTAMVKKRAATIKAQMQIRMIKMMILWADRLSTCLMRMLQMFQHQRVGIMTLNQSLQTMLGSSMVRMQAAG